MPLFIIGLFVLIGLLIMAIYNYRKGDPDDQQSPMRRERDSKKNQGDSSDDGKVLYFPTENVEKEKRKRNL